MKVYCNTCKTELKKPIFGGYTRNDLGEFIPIWYVEPCPICSNKWISVDDRLPEEYTIVIVRFDTDPIFGAGYCTKNGDWCTSDPTLDDHVKDWMDIPEAKGVERWKHN